MMDKWNVGLKESLAVKFKDGTYAKLCLKLLFESGRSVLWYYWVRMVLKVTVQKQSSK